MQKGFTLIELTVVLGVIAVLVFGSYVAVNSTRETARDIQRLAHMKEIFYGLELYFNDSATYPSGNSLELGGATAQCLDDRGFQPAGGCTGTIYIPFIQQNPKPGGAPFLYSFLEGPPPRYSISFELEAATAQLAVGKHLMTPAGIK